MLRDLKEKTYYTVISWLILAVHLIACYTGNMLAAILGLTVLLCIQETNKQANALKLRAMQIEQFQAIMALRESEARLFTQTVMILKQQNELFAAMLDDLDKAGYDIEVEAPQTKRVIH